MWENRIKLHREKYFTLINDISRHIQFCAKSGGNGSYIFSLLSYHREVCGSNEMGMFLQICFLDNMPRNQVQTLFLISSYPVTSVISFYLDSRSFPPLFLHIYVRVVFHLHPCRPIVQHENIYIPGLLWLHAHRKVSQPIVIILNTKCMLSTIKINHQGLPARLVVSINIMFLAF